MQAAFRHQRVDVGVVVEAPNVVDEAAVDRVDPPRHDHARGAARAASACVAHGERRARHGSRRLLLGRPGRAHPFLDREDLAARELDGCSGLELRCRGEHELVGTGRGVDGPGARDEIAKSLGRHWRLLSRTPSPEGPGCLESVFCARRGLRRVASVDEVLLRVAHGRDRGRRRSEVTSAVGPGLESVHPHLDRVQAVVLGERA